MKTIHPLGLYGFFLNLKTLTMFNWLKNLLKSGDTTEEKEEIVSYLIVGLGNIGEKYDDTRHNIGFEVVDYLANSKDERFEQDRLAYYAAIKSKGRHIHLIKPTTYMNLSGKATKFWMDKLKIPKERVLVVVDDLAIPFGKIRLKGKGSAGGHNGLKDIDEKLGGNNYARLRFGIGNNYPRGKQVEYVLGKWKKKEALELNEYIQKAADTAMSFCTVGLERAMNQHNKVKKPKKPKTEESKKEDPNKGPEKKEK